MEFEWDSVKDRTNQVKHKVSFREATTVFGDPLAITFDDPDHSDDEDRLLTFGITKTGKQVIVYHTQRNRKLRIISARLMDKNERSIYEEG